jgi:predicted metalloprotease with PDZ domain
VKLSSVLVATFAAASCFGCCVSLAAGLIPAPEDKLYPGEIHLTVDATDIQRRIVRVHESITGLGPDAVLLFPKWLPGNHGPTGPVDRMAGLTVTANGSQIPWTRDTVDVYAFHVPVPAGASSVEVDFQYLSGISARGRPEISQNVMILNWNALVLYPAGYYSRQIPVQPSLKLPDGWKLGSALEPLTFAGALTTFKPVTLNNLVDSPVYAGRYTAQLDLDPGGPAPVHMDLFAEKPEALYVKPEQLAAHRALVQQAYKLYGSHHYAHYDFLYSLSEDVLQKGLEHHQSSEDGAKPDLFTNWDKTAYARDLLPHEYTHSWNGKFRRPADLWTPNFNVPMQDSLLWVYEGQTEYWGSVLAGRSGLRTKQQSLDALAMTAAFYETQTGRQWRPLQDTTNDPIVQMRRAEPWRDWQRSEDYYNEGELIWLDADTLIRERSKGKHSLDDFAHAFFGINNGSYVTVTYTFDDVVAALNAVEAYDWAKFLRDRTESIGKPAPLDGLRRGGYHLVYTDSPSDYEKQADEGRHLNNQTFSIGVNIEQKDSTIGEVIWDSPAFKANLLDGDTILAVNGTAYSAEVLSDAIKAAKGTSARIELIVKNGEHYRTANIDYHDGLRYPHLERDAAASPAVLDEILAPRK